jgi:hypothetical protein
MAYIIVVFFAFFCSSLLSDFLLNSLALSSARRQQVQDEEGIHVPYTFLIDPTSACNLKCTGCWGGGIHQT